MFKRNECAIHNYNFDFEVMGSIDCLHMKGCQDKLLEFTIGNMLRGSELDMIADGSKERDLVDEKCVTKKSHILVGG